MTIGSFFIYALFALDIFVFAAYLFSLGNGKGKQAGRLGTWAMAVVSGVAVLYLGLLFTNDRFDISYVFGNSASTMPVIYKISALWAGQDGTFLLWLFFSCVISALMCRSLGDYEEWGLIYMKATEMILCVMLLMKSPFAPTPAGADISNGMGMNPLLMNLWMAVHPPVMFIGYAAAAAPFAIFLAGVSLGDAVSWLRKARGWILAAWGILGIGIFLGMYWSYEVLGWGGYWAWDPVENASLFPWIALCAAAHGAILQGRRPRFALWNGAMAASGYLLVVFGTFLTRSGVLASVSLHSFEGLELYYPLLLAMLFTTTLGMWMTVRAASLMPAKTEESKEPARAGGIGSSLLLWSVYLFWIFQIFIFVGTTYPLLSGAISGTPTPVAPTYYNTTSLLPGIPVAIILFIAPLFFAVAKGKSFPVPVFAAGLIGAAADALICLKLGVKNPAGIALCAGGSAAVVSNGIYFATKMIAGKKSFASYLSHVGAAFMIAGFIFSSLASRTERIALGPGEKTEKLGYTVAVKGFTKEEMGTRTAINVSKGNTTHDASLLFISEEFKRKRINAPYIERTAGGDVYLSPLDVVNLNKESEGHGETAAEGVYLLKKGEAQDIGGGLKLTFDKFDLSKMQSGIVGADVIAEYDGKQEKLAFEYGVSQEGEKHGEQTVQGKNVTLRITGIDAGMKVVQIEKLTATGAPEAHAAHTDTPSSQPKYAALFQLSTKPLVWTVWLGMVLLSVGTLIASWRRFKKQKPSEG